MSILEILLLGIGLSMDAFAVSICKGLSTKKLQIKHYLIIGAWFGGFQALMPTIGYFLGSTFEQYITAFDHWVAFVLLAAIGANMIKESFSKEESETNSSFCFQNDAVDGTGHKHRRAGCRHHVCAAAGCQRAAGRLSHRRNDIRLFRRWAQSRQSLRPAL